MHEKIYESKSYKILAYVKNNLGTQISINKCVEIKAHPLFLKGFVRSDSLYFPKIILQKNNNILHLLIIERCTIRINTLLKIIFPTCFDLKNIKKLNFDYLLFKNSEFIKQIIFKILGEQFNIYKYLPNFFEHDFIEEDDIFENELILSDEDLIF